MPASLPRRFRSLVFGGVVEEVGAGAGADAATVDGPLVFAVAMGDGLEFALELEEALKAGGVEAAVGGVLTDGAAGLGFVAAIAEAAGGGDLDDVGE